MSITCPTCRSENPSDRRQCLRCGTAIDLSSSPTMPFTPAQEAAARESLRFNPGEKFGERYTIIEEIGHGGMGRVYKARDHELGTTVVLKMIRPELSSRPEMIDQFRNETLFGRSISHENVVRIHDLGVIDKVRYISMDFIKGENLCELLQTSGSLTLSTCLHIAVQICQALKAAHQKNIIHQDLKPQNIMIDNSGKVYITDFGLARSLAMSESQRPAKISGTPKYFSPEQARGEESDPRSDIYSLGVILYEMVTGTAPFKADSIEGYIAKHASGKPSPPSKINPDLPPPCERIILKCLEKRREDRYQSAAELLEDLEVQVGHVHRPGAGGRRAKWRKGIVAAVSFLVAGVAFYRWVVPVLRPPRPRGQPLIAVMYAINNSGDKSLDNELRWSIPHYLSTFLYQSKYLRVLRTDRVMSILSEMKQLDEERYFSKTLDEISETSNVSHFVLPSFTKVGDSYRISISVMKAKTDVTLGEPDTVKWNKDEDYLAKLEEASQKVKAKLDLSPEEIAGDFNQSLARITTTSREALRHYTDGEKYYAQSDYASSIKALELAVREDPDFAMAYLSMANNYVYLGDHAKHRAFLQKAQSLADRVSERDRYIIQGFSSYVLDESPLKAIESYRKLIELYPQDPEARTLLGAIHRNLEEWDRALEQFDRILALDPNDLLALENKAFIYTAEGLYKEAIELCEVRPVSPRENPFFVRQVPLIHLIQGRFDLAASELEKASESLPNSLGILELQGHIHHLQGDIAAAERVYGRLKEIGESPDLAKPALRGRTWLVYLSMQQGRYRQALRDILQGIELAQKGQMAYDEIDLRLLQANLELRLGRFSNADEILETVSGLARDNLIPWAKGEALNLSGFTALGSGRIEEAKRISAELRLTIERAGYARLMRRYDSMMGHIALAEGRVGQAVQLFERALSALPHQRENGDEHALFEDGLASAYFKSGKWQLAAEAYRRIGSLTTGRLMWGDIYAKSFYWLGKIQQRSGNTSAAAGYFEDFLRLWKDADAGLPEVEDARKQLEVLKKAS